MKTLISSLLAVTIMLALPCMAQAKKNKSDQSISGKVTAVNATDGTITVSQGKSGPETTYKTAGATVTVDGTAGKLSDVTVGMNVKITVGSSPDVAATIDATAKKKGGKKNTEAPAQ